MSGFLLALGGAPVQEVAELAPHRACARRRPSGEEVAHPADEHEEADSAPERVSFCVSEGLFGSKGPPGPGMPCPMPWRPPYIPGMPFMP